MGTECAAGVAIPQSRTGLDLDSKISRSYIARTPLALATTEC
jgi:hypothetical protein